MVKRIIIGLLICLALAGTIGYFYLYQSHRDISKEAAAFSIKAEDLLKHFENDYDASAVKYVNKALEVQGEITEIQDSTLVLNHVIFCKFSFGLNTTEGKMIKVKGRCLGYDELLEEVKLDQCSIVK